jgi:hypothetical protein
VLLPALMEGHARGRDTLIERERTKAGRLGHCPRESPLGTKYCLPASGTMSDQVAGPKNRICTAGTLREIFSRLPTARMSERGLRENVAQFARASRHSTGGTSGPRYGQRRYTVLQCALLKLSTIRGGGNSGTRYGRKAPATNIWHLFDKLEDLRPNLRQPRALRRHERERRRGH